MVYSIVVEVVVNDFGFLEDHCNIVLGESVVLAYSVLLMVQRRVFGQGDLFLWNVCVEELESDCDLSLTRVKILEILLAVDIVYVKDNGVNQ